MAKRNTDTVKAMLTPGEFVIKRESAKKIGYSKLNQMNKTGKVNNKKEAKMPQGKGTYGSQVGRPPKPKKKSSLLSKLRHRRAERVKAGKWVAGEKLTSAGRKRSSKRWKAQTSKTPKQQYEEGQKSKDTGVRKATKAGYERLTHKKKKVSETKTPGKKTEKIESASQRRESKRDKEASKAVSKKKEEAVSKKKAEANKSWKKATTAAKKSGVKLSALIKQRNAAKKGTDAYAKVQNQINKIYGSEKVHSRTSTGLKKLGEAKKKSKKKFELPAPPPKKKFEKEFGPQKMQFGGKVRGDNDDVEFDEDKVGGLSRPSIGPVSGYSKGGQVTSEGYPVHGGSGNYKVGE